MFPRLFCILMICGIAAAETDFKIGPDTQLDTLSAAAGDQNYVLVWRDLRLGAGLQQMRTLSVSSTGVSSADVQISAAGALPLDGPVQRNTIAFDATTKNFLAVWADNRAGAPGIYGALITQQGAAVGTDFLIAPIGRASDNAPQVVFTGADFFVAWQDEQSSGSSANRIFWGRVSSAGVPAAAGALPLSSGQNHKLEYVVNGVAGEHLVIWQDVGATPNVTRATRIGADDSLVAPAEGTVLFQRDFGVAGFGVPIGVAFVSGEYHILSSLSAQIDSSVYKTRLRPDNSVIRPSSPFCEVGQGTTGLEEDAFPRTFYNGSDEFLFIRNSKVSNTAYHLLTKRVKLDGTDVDPNMPLIDAAPQGVLNGAMAVNIGSQYLLVWMDGRLGGAQPQRGLNIFGLLTDSGKAADRTEPFLKAVAHALPIYGNSPLVVTFGNGGSTGIVDEQIWDFGDGGTDDVGNTTHKYTAKGDYIAVLSLVRAGFMYRDFVRISVDTDALGGGGGPPQVTAGTPGPVSNGVDTNFFLTTLNASLVFNAPDVDALHLAGYINASQLPVNVKDQIVSFAVGGKTYSLTMKADGTATTDVGVKPVARFVLNRFTGGFVLQTNLDNLAAGFAALGATNSTITKPGADISVPYTFSFGSLSQSSTLTAKYVAKAGKNGRLSFFFGVDGKPGPGFFRIFNGSAKESAKGAHTHQIVVIGNAALPGGESLVKATSGFWRISVGNYSEDVPVSSLVDNGLSYTLNAGKGKVGLSQFYYIKKSGQFGIMMNLLPADGAEPSGMPLSTSPYSRVDVAVSVNFDLDSGAQFQASGYLRLGRNKANSKKWKLR